MIKIDDDQLNAFLKEKGYAKATIRNYGKFIRRANREELTIDDIDQICENRSCQTRCKLKTAVRLLEEFNNWEKE